MSIILNLAVLECLLALYMCLGVEHFKSQIWGRLFREGNGLKIWCGFQHYFAYEGALKEL